MRSIGRSLLRIDVAAARHAIRPEVYGTSLASKKTLTDLRIPVNRWGGNGTTRYNWQLDVHNTAELVLYAVRRGVIS